jgi:ABC-2 type transport system ATP-binding protein
VVSREANISELFVKLETQNIAVTSLRNKSNRLEELFIRLVGNKGAAA